MANNRCSDNRFEVIAKAKDKLIRATNIEDCPKEMEVLDNILFRMWQCGFLDGNWHTGTPTEEGKYLCWVSFPDACKDGEDSWKCKWLNGEWIDDEVNGKIPLKNLGFKVIAWQKIELYKEASK